MPDSDALFYGNRRPMWDWIQDDLVQDTGPGWQGLALRLGCAALAGLLVAEIVVLLGMAAWSAADGPAWVPAGLVVVLGCAAGLFLGSDGTLLNRHCQRIATTGAQYQECVDQINADRITGHDTAAAP